MERVQTASDREKKTGTANTLYIDHSRRPPPTILLRTLNIDDNIDRLDAPLKFHNFPNVVDQWMRVTWLLKYLLLGDALRSNNGVSCVVNIAKSKTRENANHVVYLDIVKRFLRYLITSFTGRTNSFASSPEKSPFSPQLRHRCAGTANVRKALGISPKVCIEIISLAIYNV